MTPPPPNRAEATFNSALARPSGEREAFLAEACGTDTVLMSQVRGLLAAHDAAGDFLQADSPAVERELARLKPEEAGERIGPYKLLQQIGEGGFGSVWMAEQEQPVRRRVALKIIKLGMDTKEVIARFEQERQALALMDHPNIAKVLDAGATQFGRPFFVMELVRGVKITEYCDQQELSTAERIELFVHVCQAVQHAHQKGIIHRDIKPSNILVTINDGEAVPKVIDFGVAKATQGRLTDGTLFTQFEQMIGTPLYMSPEQAEMTSLDIDTRSDIYSLGVLLYELLTGHTPIEQDTMARVGMDEIRRIIREVDPPRPSMRVRTLDGNELTTMAKRRHTDAAKLPGALRGDLDWIVMKCLEKDRKRRYDTANGLALDLQRHLKNEVVVARPPTTAYLLSKLIKRNKSAVAAGGTVVLALIVGFGVAVWQANRAKHEAQRSAVALDELRATAPAFAEQARGLAAREQFADAIAKLDYAIKLRPDAAEYLVAKADLLQCQLQLAEAAAIYREALRVKPGLARAEASAKLCDELLAAPLSEAGKLTRESLAKLHLAMQKQQRPAAELLPVARLLGEEKKLVVEYWLARLKDLPISAEKPLKDRLTVREDGRLGLDLRGTKVVDLSPLAGAPLGELNVSGSDALSDLSPLRGIDLVELGLNATGVADLTPLREMHTLQKLDLTRSKVTDLAPLSALRLTELSLYGTRVTDLTPIQKMPLEALLLSGTRVTDLAPLSGMPIKILNLDLTPVRDFSPLARMPLEKCYLAFTEIADLTVLRGRPLKELSLLGCDGARHYAVLAEIETLESLLLPETFRSLPDEELTAIGALRSHPRLRQIQADVPGSMYYSAIQSKDLFWQDWDREQSIITPLRQAGIKFSLEKLADGTFSLRLDKQPLRDLALLKDAPLGKLRLNEMPVRDLTALASPTLSRSLKELYVWRIEATDFSPVAACRNLVVLEAPDTPLASLECVRDLKLNRLRINTAKVTDLSPLAGMPLESLDVNDTAVADLSPLQGMSLTRLEGERTQISNLAALHGMPLEYLAIGKTKVADLAPLRGMPLRTLQLYGLTIPDLSPLRGMPLEDLWLGFHTGDLAALRGMPLKKLKLHDCAPQIDFTPLAEAKQLTSLTLPADATGIDFLRALPKLARISPREDWKNGGRPAQTAEEYWQDYDEQGWLRPLRKAGIAIKGAKKQPDGTWKLDLSESTISDLTLLKGVPISFLNLKKTGVSDLSPLRGLPLKTLILDETAVADLSPLQGMPIEQLELRRVNITSLAALRGLPLKNLQLGSQPITDLEPLRGMTLTELGIPYTKVTDLSPLQGMPLAYLDLNGTAVTNLSVVRSLPLTKLRLRACPQLTDLSPLAEARELTSLALPPNARDIDFLRKLPKLERLSFVEDPRSSITPDKTAAEFWREYDTQPWLHALRATGLAGNNARQLEDGTWDVNFANSPLRDLTPLRGSWISVLSLNTTPVADLTPLRGHPLKKLNLSNTSVTDLSPLQGMPVAHLVLRGTKAADLSALRGLPLTELFLYNCKELTDLSPLADCRELKTITLPPNAKDIEFLRQLPKLERISFQETPNDYARPPQTAAEFWKEYDAGKKPAPAP